MQVKLFRYLLLSLLWSLLTWLLAPSFASGPFWVALVSVPLFGLPIALAGLYTGTVAQIRRLAVFSRRGWLFRLLSGRLLRGLLWTAWGLACAFFLLLQFHTYTAAEWAAFFLVIPVFFLVFSLCRRLLMHEVKPYAVTAMALIWARRVAPVVMVLVFFALRMGWGEVPAHESLEQAIDANRAAVRDMRGSALAAELSYYLALYEGAKDYALGRLGDLNAAWALALTALLGLVVFHAACTLLSSFLVPAREYRRVFLPLNEVPAPPPVPLPRLALIAAVATFVACFVYLPLFAYLEAWTQQRPEPVQGLRAAEARVLPRLEQIDEDFFREGTLAALEEARVEALREVDLSLQGLDRQADHAFDGLAGNVDAWLDWYYSLTGEYARIAHLMSGELEAYLLRKLEETLEQGDAFAEVQAALNQALATHEEAQRRYREKAQAILSSNRVARPAQPVHVVGRLSLEDVLSPPLHEDMIALEERLLAGGGSAALGGVATALMAKKVVGKVMGKNLFKLAGKSLGKIAMGKAAGSSLGGGAGAAAGAAVGSVVPGLGTAIGAAVGGILGGLAVGVTVDKMLIELEETVHRDAFKQEILGAIEAARDEFHALLRRQDQAAEAEPPPPFPAPVTQAPDHPDSLDEP